MKDEVNELKIKAREMVNTTGKNLSDMLLFMLALALGLILNLTASAFDHVAKMYGEDFYRYYAVTVLIAGAGIILLLQRYIKKHYSTPYNNAKKILKDIEDFESKHEMVIDSATTNGRKH